MNRLDELIQQLCPDGVEYQKLGDVCSDIIVPMRDRPKVFDGNTPWCRIEDVEGQYIHKSNSNLGVSDRVIMEMNLKVFPIGTVICSCSASLGTYVINTQPLITNQTFIGLVCGNNMYNRFLRYWLETQTQYLKSKATKGTIPYISKKFFEQLRIPIPPLEIQREIVRILDQFTELTTGLTAELTAELTARKKQYEYYRNELLMHSKEVTWMTLGDIGNVCMCKRIMKAETSSEGDVPFFKIGTFGKEPDAYISQEKFDEYRQKYSFPKKGDVLISAAGTIGRTVIYDGKPAYYQDSNIVWLDNDETKVLNKYLFYYYQLQPWAVSTGGTIARLYNDNISKAKIAVPSLEDQHRIVSILDRFDALCNDLTSGLPAEIEARRKQYEYYRDKLLDFPEKT